jgi:hypothetical protein
LSGEGRFTVFAPTDDAFGKLPAGTIEALLADIPALTDILLYHVVGGRVLAEDVVLLEEAETLLGETVTIRVEDEKVFINDAEVIITDIIADNGVIHVIDSVLSSPQKTKHKHASFSLLSKSGWLNQLASRLIFIRPEGRDQLNRYARHHRVVAIKASVCVRS